MSDDIDLTCQDCNATFIFTSSDQDFYAEKGFTQPKRCKPCRDAKKAKNGDKGGGQRRDDRPRSGGCDRERKLFDVTCTECGVETQVPFEPRTGSPVYCRECFKVKSITRDGQRR